MNATNQSGKKYSKIISLYSKDLCLFSQERKCYPHNQPDTMG